MTDTDRRSFLKYSGAILGGIAAGGSVVAAESTDRFVVESEDLSKGDLRRSDVEVVHEMAPVGYAVVEGAESAVESLGVEYAPDVELELDLPGGDLEPTAEPFEATDEPLYGLQWDKQAQNVPEAHERTRGEGSRIAIIDTGVDPFHPDLKDPLNRRLSANFTGDGGSFADVSYHGTHVAGIAAADASNDRGITGTAPGTDLLALRVFSGSGGASFAAILAAMVYSAEVGCDAANLSLGAYPVPRKGLGKFYGKVLNSITSYCRRRGTLLVVAAGNDAADLQHDGGVVSLPNEAANVASISATGPVGFLSGRPGLAAPPSSPATYTNYGTNAIDVSAPGGNAYAEGASIYDNVFSTIPTYVADPIGIPPYYWLAGTSMAAPQVTGAAALVASQLDDRRANAVRRAIRNSADAAPGDKAYHGKGHLDTLGAVESVAGGKGNGKGRKNGNGSGK